MFGLPGAFIEDLNRPAPRRFLAVDDLPKIQHLPLNHATIMNAPVRDGVRFLMMDGPHEVPCQISQRDLSFFGRTVGMSDTALIFAAYRKEIERAASNKYNRFAIGDYEIRQLLRFRESWVRPIVHYAVRSAASQVAIKLY